MSKKQRLFNRLDNLFSNIQENVPEDNSLSINPPEISGWAWQCDGQGIITSCSPEVTDLLKISPEEMIGKSIFSFGLSNGSSSKLEKILNSENFPSETIIDFRVDGTQYRVRFTVLTCVHENSHISGWSGYNQLLSESKISYQRESDSTKVKPHTTPQPQSLNPLNIDSNSQPWTQEALESLKKQQPIFRPSAENSPAVMAVPFLLGENGSGLLEILDEQSSRSWSEDDQLLVNEIANQLGIAIENAQLYTEIQAVASERQKYLLEAERRAIELETAAEIARDAAKILTLEDLLNQNVYLICEKFGYYHASIFLLDEEGQYAVVKASMGVVGQEMVRRKHKLAVGSNSIIGQVTDTRTPLIINDVLGSELHFRNPLLPETRSEMAVPLLFGNRVIGAIDLQSKTPNAFVEDDVSVFNILADQIAVAIENARSYEISQQAMEDIKEADRVKTQFLANMSHELRTPLNSIIGFSRVIIKGIDGPINDIQEQDLGAIYNSGQHLLSLINDILDLSKIEAGKMSLAFEDLVLADLVNSVMSTATGLVKDKPIKLKQDIPDDLPIVKADTTRIRQVLLNFISNAAKFTEEGSITVKAEVAYSPEGSREVLVTVTDTGPGIAEKDQYKLFRSFSQVDDSPTRKTGGTGLGLAISRNLIQMHGGRIGLLSSEVNKGSTFFFTLPLPEEVKPISETLKSSDRLILSIDDEIKIIQLYQRFLDQQGYQVVPLTDPKAAVETARKLKPLAITLDIMMPEKDGWHVLQELKNDPDTKNIPVIICSILEEGEKGINLGATDYLAKPFLQEDLLQAINRLGWDDKSHNVLVIDDQPDSLRLVEKILGDNPNYLVTLAQGGPQGWDLIQSTRPDVIIMDLFMPEINGFAILEKLKSDTELQEIPVIILTGADLSAAEHEQLSKFGEQLLSKSFLHPAELLNSLGKALQQIRR